MARHTKPTSLRRARKPRPDALSSQEPRRAAANAFDDRREIYRRTFRMHPGALPPARRPETAGGTLRGGSHFLLPGAREREFLRVHEFSWRRSLQPSSFGDHRYDSVARRISYVIYAVSGGN